MHLSKGLSSLERVSPGFLWEHLVHFPAHLKFWRSHTEREQKWVQPAAGTVIVTALWCYTNASAVQARTSKWNAALEQRHYALPCPALWHTAQPPFAQPGPRASGFLTPQELLVLSSRAEGQIWAVHSPPAPKGSSLSSQPCLITEQGSCRAWRRVSESLEEEEEGEEEMR